MKKEQVKLFQMCENRCNDLQLQRLYDFAFFLIAIILEYILINMCKNILK